jgi:cell division septal protein FtsQ
MVRRDPPATLIVEVVERSPIALLLNPDGSEWMIDDEGFIFPVTNYPGAQDLPVLTHSQNITGARAGERLSDPKILSAARVLQTARTLDSSIYDLISEINLDHRQDLLMYTTDCGVPVVFGPEEDVEVKLWSLKAFWETVAVKEDPAMLEYLDLRFKNQVVAKWAHGTVSSQNEVRSDSTDIIKD